MRSLRRSLLLMALAVGALDGAMSSQARAQTSGAAQTSLSVGASLVTILSPTAAEYDQRYSVVGSVTFSGTCASAVSTNPCSITIWSSNATIGGNARPISDVQWQVSSCTATTTCQPVTSWQPLTTTATHLVSIAAPTPGQSSAATFSGTINFRIQIDWATHPAMELYAPAIQLSIGQ